jgi:hypothetical protein
MSRIAFIYDAHVGLQHTFRILAQDWTPMGAWGPTIDIVDIRWWVLLGSQQCLPRGPPSTFSH